MHAHSLHREILHVPLIIRAPGLKPLRIGSRERLVDISPTALDLLGVAYRRAQFQGRSAVPLLSGRRAPDTPVFSERERESQAQEQIKLKSLISGNWKLITPTAETPFSKLLSRIPFGLIYPVKDKELYDLSADQGEKRNLALRYLSRTRAMDTAIRRAIERNESRALPKAKPYATPENNGLRQLKDLGYIR